MTHFSYTSNTIFSVPQAAYVIITYCTTLIMPFNKYSHKNALTTVNNLGKTSLAQDKRGVQINILALVIGHLTLKMPRIPASENIVCLCRLLNILANFSNLLFEYRQTVWTHIRLLLEEQSDLGPHCLQNDF